MGVARELLLKGSESRWLAGQLSRRRFVRRAVKRFMPGEEAEDALAAGAMLGEHGIPCIFTILGENVADSEAASGVADTYVAFLGLLSTAGVNGYISVKPTHLGLDHGFQSTLANLDRLAAAAARHERIVAVDMESTRYVDPTLDLYRELRARHDNVGVCLQAYLYRTGADLDDLLGISPMIRLVKGAYKEPADLAYPKKSDVDDSFLRLAERMLEAAREDRARVSFGTHDESIIGEINRKAADMRVPRESYEFQLLYGIQRGLQESLVAAGYRLHVLISYGSYWFPWYMRRLAERPANVGFVLRSMVRG
jgi:proline dehydrogenase